MSKLLVKKALKQAVRGSDEARDVAKPKKRKKKDTRKREKKGFEWEERYPLTELDAQSESRDSARSSSSLIQVNKLNMLNVKVMKQQRRTVRSKKLVKSVSAKLAFRVSLVLNFDPLSILSSLKAAFHHLVMNSVFVT